MKPIVSRFSDLILRSTPSPVGRWLASRRMAARTTSPAAILLKAMQSIVRRRIAYAMLLRIRLGKDADMIRTLKSLY